MKKGNKYILHIILTADNETIKSRVKSDNSRMKDIALDWLANNLTFLDNNFPDALSIKTDNRNIDDIITEVVKAGWVISEHSNPRKIKEWYRLIVQGKEKEIVEYFDADNGHTLNAIRNNLLLYYAEPHSHLYYKKALMHMIKEII